MLDYVGHVGVVSTSFVRVSINRLCNLHCAHTY